MLIWVLGSAFLRFIILSREQAHITNALEIIRIHRTQSSVLPTSPGGMSTYEIINFKGSGIKLVECLSASGFAIIPLTLTVLIMNLLNPPRTICYVLELIGVAWSSRSVSVALRTRTRPRDEQEETSGLLSRDDRDSSPLDHHAGEESMEFSEYFKEGHRQDHLLLLFPIVLLNVYFVSLYTRN